MSYTNVKNQLYRGHRKIARNTYLITHGNLNLDDSFPEVSEKVTKSDALEALFWIAVADEFGLWDKSVVGVRKGYKVVWFG